MINNLISYLNFYKILLIYLKEIFEDLFYRIYYGRLNRWSIRYDITVIFNLDNDVLFS